MNKLIKCTNIPLTVKSTYYGAEIVYNFKNVVDEEVWSDQNSLFIANKKIENLLITI